MTLKRSLAQGGGGLWSFGALRESRVPIGIARARPAAPLGEGVGGGARGGLEGGDGADEGAAALGQLAGLDGALEALQVRQERHPEGRTRGRTVGGDKR